MPCAAALNALSTCSLGSTMNKIVFNALTEKFIFRGYKENLELKKTLKFQLSFTLGHA